MRAFRFLGAYKRAAAHLTARGKTVSMPALVCVYLIASDAHASRALTPFLSQVFLTRCHHLASHGALVRSQPPRRWNFGARFDEVI